MESKKHTTADFREKRPAFLLLGLTLSLSLTLMAFEWKKDVALQEIDFEGFQDIPLEDIPITIHKPPTPPPPPPKVYTLIEIEEEPEIEIDPSDLFPDDFENFEVPDLEFDTPIEVAPDDNQIFIVEDQASFPGGNEKWVKFLRKNLKYPRPAQRMGIEGNVFLSFIVDSQGVISNIEVVRGIGAGCDEEAIRVLSKSPAWNPGLQRGRPVKTRMALLIKFKLN